MKRLLRFPVSLISTSKSKSLQLFTLRSLQTSAPDDPRKAPREVMPYDVVIVGAGPAGLSAAIRLKQLAAKENREISVCVVEKGAEVGAHILSGNVFDPKALNYLIPDWKAKGAPLNTPVSSDKLFLLTDKYAFPLPIPGFLHNTGNYVISLGDLVKWLGKQAEELGVEIYPGFAAAEVLYEDDSKRKVVGIATGDSGIKKDGTLKESFARGMELRAKQTFFAEGCRGSLSEQIMTTFGLRGGRDPQTYGIGLKEVWEIDPKKFQAGSVTHTIGWPIRDSKTWIGTFAYHQNPNRLLLGMVVGLNYQNTNLNPYLEFQRFKHHPKVKSVLEGGRIISYGARAINEGGIQAIPRLTFPGGALLGCSAGFLNVPKIKGSHYAMQSGILAAESMFAQHKDKPEWTGEELTSYETAVDNSWIRKELHQVRNVHPALEKFGLFGWMAYSALEGFILKGRGPWTFHNQHKDYQATKPKSQSKPLTYPKPDNVISFDLLTNLQRSGVNHEEDQPPHLRIKPHLKDVPLKVSLPIYDGPEQRFCPAKVYEYVDAKPEESGGVGKRLVINAQNCVHCKTCDIKPPENFIQWTTPEGGGGPNYSGM